MPNLVNEPDEAAADDQARHGRERFFVEGEGLLGEAAPTARVAATPTPRVGRAADFRFSRVGPKGPRTTEAVREKVAKAMGKPQPDTRGRIPAGYTYLGQFVDHDLTFDVNASETLGDPLSPTELIAGASPKLDLDSLYARGPNNPLSVGFYSDEHHLRVGATKKAGSIPARAGADLPRVGKGSAKAARKANIPDLRNDENLAVAQTHLAMIKFHNRVVNTLPASVPSSVRFRRARRVVTLHYQWMLRHDYLTRICDRAIVNDVFKNGRKVFEPDADPLSVPTMPIEFSVAAFRFGHSMVRTGYNWNREFPGQAGSLDFLFAFSGTGGDFFGDSALPSNWIVDWRRLYPFEDVGRDDLRSPAPANRANPIDTKLTNILSDMPLGAFGGKAGDKGTFAAHLAFRNLTRASQLELATGQEMAKRMRKRGVTVKTLTAAQVLGGGAGAVLTALTPAQRTRFAAETPLWFYILREAELNKGRLTGVGARLVAETFHRAMQGSRSSIVREPDWRPKLGQGDRFTMMDLLLFTFDGKKKLLAPLGD